MPYSYVMALYFFRGSFKMLNILVDIGIGPLYLVPWFVLKHYFFLVFLRHLQHFCVGLCYSLFQSVYCPPHSDVSGKIHVTFWSMLLNVVTQKLCNNTPFKACCLRLLS